MGERVVELEQQIAHLKWRGMQNERAIKNSLCIAKNLKERDLVQSLSTDNSTGKSVWKHSVVRDELRRPLIITDEELYHIKSSEIQFKKKIVKVI